MSPYRGEKKYEVKIGQRVRAGDLTICKKPLIHLEMIHTMIGMK